MKKYILIGILVITVALALSAFTLASNRSTGSQVGLAQSPAILDKGERDSISPSLQLAGSQVGLVQSPAILDKGERDSLSPIAVTGFQTPAMSNYALSSIAVTGFRTPPMSSYVQSSGVSGIQTSRYYQYGPASIASGVQSSGSYLVVVGQYHDR